MNVTLRLALAAALASLAFVGAAQAQQAYDPGGKARVSIYCKTTVAGDTACPGTGGGGGGGITTYTTTDKGGTVTSGGTAQAAIASNASRKIWCIQNDPSATEILSVRLSGTASATAGIILQAGAQACSTTLVDTAAVSVFGATTGHRWFGLEGQ